MNSGASRLESIDVARGLAALSVVVYHQGYGRGLVGITGRPEFDYISWPGATIAVPLFFVISGFCIHMGGLNQSVSGAFTRRFFLQRFFRIYPPLVVAIFISAGVALITGRNVTVWQLLTHLALTNAFFSDYRLNPVLWSVSVEVFLYLLYPVWLAFRNKYGLVVGFLLGLAVSGASGVLSARLAPEPSGTSMWFFLNVWCGWLAGAVLAELLRLPSFRLLRSPSWWAGGCLLIGTHVYFASAGFYTGAWQYVRLPITIMVCIWPLSLLIAVGECLAKRPGIHVIGSAWRALRQIGIFSYSLYLIHCPMASLSYLLVAQLSSNLAKATLLVGWLLVVLIASWMHYLAVEVPFVRLGRRVVGRQQIAESPRLGRMDKLESDPIG